MYNRNHACIIGCLGQDPEIKSFQNGGKIANLRVATSRRWKDRNTGELKEETEWHSVCITNEASAKFAEQALRKGSFVHVTGRLRTRKWQDRNGGDRYTTEILVAPFDGELGLLDRNPSGNGGAAPPDGAAPPPDAGGGQRPDFDDDIPF